MDKKKAMLYNDAFLKKGFSLFKLENLGQDSNLAETLYSHLMP